MSDVQSITDEQLAEFDASIDQRLAYVGQWGDSSVIKGAPENWRLLKGLIARLRAAEAERALAPLEVQRAVEREAWTRHTILPWVSRDQLTYANRGDRHQIYITPDGDMGGAVLAEWSDGEMPPEGAR